MCVCEREREFVRECVCEREKECLCEGEKHRATHKGGDTIRVARKLVLPHPST